MRPMLSFEDITLGAKNKRQNSCRLAQLGYSLSELCYTMFMQQLKVTVNGIC